MYCFLFSHNNPPTFGSILPSISLVQKLGGTIDRKRREEEAEIKRTAEERERLEREEIERKAREEAERQKQQSVVQSPHNGFSNGYPHHSLSPQMLAAFHMKQQQYAAWLHARALHNGYVPQSGMPPHFRHPVAIHSEVTTKGSSLPAGNGSIPGTVPSHQNFHGLIANGATQPSHMLSGYQLAQQHVPKMVVAIDAKQEAECRQLLTRGTGCYQRATHQNTKEFMQAHQDLEAAARLAEKMPPSKLQVECYLALITYYVSAAEDKLNKKKMDVCIEMYDNAIKYRNGAYQLLLSLNGAIHSSEKAQFQQVLLTYENLEERKPKIQETPTQPLTAQAINNI